MCYPLSMGRWLAPPGYGILGRSTMPTLFAQRDAESSIHMDRPRRWGLG